MTNPPTTPSPQVIHLRRIADAAEEIVSILRIRFADDLGKTTPPATGEEELAFATKKDHDAWAWTVARDGDTCRFCDASVVWVGEGRRAFMVETGDPETSQVVACRDCAITYTETPDDARFDVNAAPARPTYTEHSAQLLRATGFEVHPSDVRDKNRP